MARTSKQSAEALRAIHPPQRLARIHALYIESLELQAERAQLIADKTVDGRADAERDARIESLMAEIHRNGYEEQPAEARRVGLTFG